MLKGYRPNM